MAEKNMMLTKQEQMQFCLDRDIKPPRLYELGFPHNNCGGFCIKSGQAQFKLLLEKLPERYDWHIEQEKQLRKTVPNARPFLRKVENKKMNYLWLEDFKVMIEAEPKQVDLLDWGGCGCMLEETP